MDWYTKCINIEPNPLFYKELESNLNDKILTPQNNSLATYATKLSKDESIINWNEDAEIIIAKVKAFAGWPGVQAELFDVKFKIHQAKCINNSIIEFELVFNKFRVFREYKSASISCSFENSIY